MKLCNQGQLLILQPQFPGVTQIAQLIQHLVLAVLIQVGTLLRLTLAVIKDLLQWKEIPTPAINSNWYKKAAQTHSSTMFPLHALTRMNVLLAHCYQLIVIPPIAKINVAVIILAVGSGLAPQLLCLSPAFPIPNPRPTKKLSAVAAALKKSAALFSLKHPALNTTFVVSDSEGFKPVT